MALFGKLFSKETCAICGAEVGMTKKRKLADAVICKDCAAQLSPWFEERKESTLSQVREQLALREENRRLFDQFEITAQIGGSGAIFVDETHRRFCALEDTSTGGLLSTEQVHDVRGLREANADIVDLACVQSAKVSVTETRNELKHSVNGEQASYDPPRWRYGESFTITIEVDHPYIRTMRVPLGAVTIETEGERKRASVGAQALGWLLDDPNFDIRNRAATFEGDTVVERLLRGGWEMPDYAFGFRCSTRNWGDIQHFTLRKQQAEQMCALLQS